MVLNYKRCRRDFLPTIELYLEFDHIQEGFQVLLIEEQSIFKRDGECSSAHGIRMGQSKHSSVYHK